MPILLIIEDERFPDYSLVPSDGIAGRTKVSSGKGWFIQDRIELTDEEYADWKRVSAEYETWLDRIQKSTAGVDR